MNQIESSTPTGRRHQHHFRRGAIIVIIILAAAAYGWTSLVLFRHLTTTNTNNQTATSSGYTRDAAGYSVEAANRPSIGDASAEIVIAEFIRYQCESCRTESEMIRQAVSLYQGRIRYIIRDYPAGNDEWSARLSEAAACAGEQGKFWIMHDRMAGTPNIADQTKLNTIARGAGLDMAQFDSCFSGRKYQSQIKQDLTDGQTLGVTSAPTIFINGRTISGQITEATFYNIIDSVYPNLKILHQNTNQTEEDNPVSTT